MNLKKAKALRKEAVKLTGGVVARAYNEGRKGVKYTTGGVDEYGKPGLKAVDITGKITLVPHCTRAVYKALKRAA
jgi:hypothetical protein